MNNITIEEQNNNQLFLDVYFKQQELIRCNNKVDTVINELQLALEKTKGKHWITQHELTFEEKREKIRKDIKISP